MSSIGKQLMQEDYCLHHVRDVNSSVFPNLVPLFLSISNSETIAHTTYFAIMCLKTYTNCSATNGNTHQRRPIYLTASNCITICATDVWHKRICKRSSWRNKKILLIFVENWNPLGSLLQMHNTRCILHYLFFNCSNSGEVSLKLPNLIL